ncbi:MAG: cadherin-like beta sandwich domain-containing protein [Ruminococcus sp.]|nr:cadherin-like beta sandwich domain-containing protein [Ruminococcus sp.]
MFKKIFVLLTFILGIIAFPVSASAASGKISITSSSTVVVGNTVTVTVTLSSGSALGAWEFDLNYDSNFLKLTSSNAENNGTYFVNYGNGSTKSKSYTLKFRALKSGTTSLTIGSYDVYAYDTSGMSITKSNKKITIMTQEELEASYSKDNNLKDLTVEGFELDKAFDKDTLEYSINVPTGTNTVNIKATVNDETASVSGAGEAQVTEGLNTLPIVITAQNGDQKTYNLLVNVEDQNPINVTVNNKDYIVVKNASLLTAPATFSETTVDIDSFSIPAFENTSASLTLVGLKDTSGNIGLFIYNNDEYLPYNEMSLKNYMLIPVPFTSTLNLIKTTTTINDEEVEVYKYSKDSHFVIINAQNLEDGETNIYLYDTENNSAILYDETYMNEMTTTIKNYSYIIIAFTATLIIMLIIILSLLHSSKKKQKKMNKFIEKQEAKLEATRKLNDVVDEVKKITNEEKKTNNKTEVKKVEDKNKEKEPKEEVEVNKIKVDPNNEIKKVLDDDEEVYDLFEDEKKSKKRKKKK